MEIQINLPASHDVNRAEQHVQIDLTKLNAETIGQLVLHGLTQKIGDAAAGKKGDEALAAMQKVMDQLIAGDWTARRSGGSSRDTLEKMMIAKARPSFKKHVDGYSGMTAGEKDDAIWELIDQLGEGHKNALIRAAEAQIKMDKEQADMMKGLDLDL